MQRNNQFLRDASREQVDLQFQDKLEMDNRLLFRKTMEALTERPASAADRDINENGVSIFGLWDGLSDSKPPTYAGKAFASGHNT